MMGQGPKPQQIYVDAMFNLGGAAVTTLTAMNSGTTANGSGSYSPKANGSLIGIDIQLTPQAASSLAQSGYITLNCTMWAPVNTLTIYFTGFGLATAPQAVAGSEMHVTWDDLNLPVLTSVPIVGNVIYQYSPVTPFIAVVGRFSAKFPTAAPAP